MNALTPKTLAVIVGDVAEAIREARAAARALADMIADLPAVLGHMRQHSDANYLAGLLARHLDGFADALEPVENALAEAVEHTDQPPAHE